jgi:uncharacterized OsmC-like protein
MFTVMGIKAREMGVDLSGSTAEVTKIMAADPRRISEIHVIFEMKVEADETRGGAELSVAKTKTILERTALTCPVHFSLHPDIKREIVFNWK